MLTNLHEKELRFFLFFTLSPCDQFVSFSDLLFLHSPIIRAVTLSHREHNIFCKIQWLVWFAKLVW